MIEIHSHKGAYSYKNDGIENISHLFFEHVVNGEYVYNSNVFNSTCQICLETRNN